MSKLDEYLGIESLDNDLANKDSNYAYITYLETIGMTDVNAKGELVQFNRESLEGQVDLVTVQQLEKLRSNFPSKVKGKAIKYGNLENMASLCFERLKQEYSELGESDSYVESKIQQLESFADKNGRLGSDHQTKESLDDLANKVFVVQEAVRNLQSRHLSNSNARRK